jgi:acylphosphatase
VQGVYFRAYVESAAVALGLTGYVRNLADGDVELEAEGNRARLEKLVERLKAGPPRARVDSVNLEWTEFCGQFAGFVVRY